MFAWFGEVGDTGEGTHQNVGWVQTAVVEPLACLVHVNSTERRLPSHTQPHTHTGCSKLTHRLVPTETPLRQLTLTQL